MDHEGKPRSRGHRARELVAVDALILGIFAASRLSCAPATLPFADGGSEGLAGVQEPGGAVRVVPADSVPFLAARRGDAASIRPPAASPPWESGEDDQREADAPSSDADAAPDFPPPLVWQEGSFAFPGHWPLPAARLLNLPVRTASLDPSDFAAIQGIGPVLAERIVQEIGRRQGRLEPEDFGAVRGLGTAKLRLLREGLGPMADVAPAEGAGKKPGSQGPLRRPRGEGAGPGAACPASGGREADASARCRSRKETQARGSEEEPWAHPPVPALRLPSAE